MHVHCVHGAVSYSTSIRKLICQFFILLSICCIKFLQLPLKCFKCWPFIRFCSPTSHHYVIQLVRTKVWFGHPIATFDFFHHLTEKKKKMMRNKKKTVAVAWKIFSWSLLSKCHTTVFSINISHLHWPPFITGLLIGCGKKLKIMWKFLAILCINMHWLCRNFQRRKKRKGKELYLSV